VFLSCLREAGFKEVIGVEPSPAAIEDAKPDIRSAIREGVFTEADFEPFSFDLICCFQTLEHIPDPRAFVEASRRLLRPGGMLVVITHDYKALINRALGRRSPIIDIEHLQLFCKPSLSYLMKEGGLKIITIKSIVNRYPISYWLRLAPLPTVAKGAVEWFLNVSGANRIRLAVNVGNLMTVARKGS
jgi:SAM-dependent methyltransferase